MASSSQEKCPDCAILRLKFEKYDQEQTSRFLSLKKKIVSTDLLISKYREQTTELSTCRSKLDITVTKIKSKDNELSIVENNLHAERNRVQQLIDRNADLDKKCQGQELELARNRDTIFSLESVNKQLTVSHKDLQKQFDNYKQEVHLKRINKTKTAKDLTVSLREEVKSLKAELKKQRQDYESRISHLQSVTVAAVPAVSGRRRAHVKEPLPCPPKDLLSKPIETKSGSPSPVSVDVLSTPVQTLSDSEEDVSGCDTDSDSEKEVSKPSQIFAISRTRAPETSNSQQIVKQQSTSRKSAELLDVTSRHSDLTSRHSDAAPQQVSKKSDTSRPMTSAASNKVMVSPPLRRSQRKSSSQHVDDRNERTLSTSSVECLEDVEAVLSRMTRSTHAGLISPFRHTPVRPDVNLSGSMSPGFQKRLRLSSGDGTVENDSHNLHPDVSLQSSTGQDGEERSNVLDVTKLIGEISSSSSDEDDEVEGPVQLPVVCQERPSNVKQQMCENEKQELNNIASEMTKPTAGDVNVKPEYHSSLLPEVNTKTSGLTVVDNKSAENRQIEENAAANPPAVVQLVKSDNDLEEQPKLIRDTSTTAQSDTSKPAVKPCKPRTLPVVKRVVRRAAPALPNLDLLSRKYPMRDSSTNSGDEASQSSPTNDQQVSTEAIATPVEECLDFPTNSGRQRISRVSVVTSAGDNSVKPIVDDVKSVDSAPEQDNKPDVGLGIPISTQEQQGQLVQPQLDQNIEVCSTENSTKLVHAQQGLPEHYSGNKTDVTAQLQEKSHNQLATENTNSTSQKLTTVGATISEQVAQSSKISSVPSINVGDSKSLSTQTQLHNDSDVADVPNSQQSSTDKALGIKALGGVSKAGDDKASPHRHRKSEWTLRRAKMKAQLTQQMKEVEQDSKRITAVERQVDEGWEAALKRRAHKTRLVAHHNSSDAPAPSAVGEKASTNIGPASPSSLLAQASLNTNPVVVASQTEQKADSSTNESLPTPSQLTVNCPDNTACKKNDKHLSSPPSRRSLGSEQTKQAPLPSRKSPRLKDKTDVITKGNNSGKSDDEKTTLNRLHTDNQVIEDGIISSNQVSRGPSSCKNAMQTVATHKNAMQTVATHKNAMQTVATHKNAMQTVATHKTSNTTNPLQRKRKSDSLPTETGSKVFQKGIVEDDSDLKTRQSAQNTSAKSSSSTVQTHSEISSSNSKEKDMPALGKLETAKIDISECSVQLSSPPVNESTSLKEVQSNSEMVVSAQDASSVIIKTMSQETHVSTVISVDSDKSNISQDKTETMVTSLTDTKGRRTTGNTKHTATQLPSINNASASLNESSADKKENDDSSKTPDVPSRSHDIVDTKPSITPAADDDTVSTQPAALVTECSAAPETKVQKVSVSETTTSFGMEQCKHSSNLPSAEADQSSIPAPPRSSLKLEITIPSNLPDGPCSPSAPCSPDSPLSPPQSPTKGDFGSPPLLVIHEEPAIIPTSPDKSCCVEYNNQAVDQLRVFPISNENQQVLAESSSISALPNIDSVSTPLTSLPSTEQSRLASASKASDNVSVYNELKEDNSRYIPSNSQPAVDNKYVDSSKDITNPLSTTESVVHPLRRSGRVKKVRNKAQKSDNIAKVEAESVTDTADVELNAAVSSSGDGGETAEVGVLSVKAAEAAVEGGIVSAAGSVTVDLPVSTAAGADEMGSREPSVRKEETDKDCFSSKQRQSRQPNLSGLELVDWMYGELGLSPLLSHHVNIFHGCDLLAGQASPYKVAENKGMSRRVVDSQPSMPLDVIKLTSLPKVPAALSTSRASAMVAKEMAMRSMFPATNRPVSKKKKKVKGKKQQQGKKKYNAVPPNDVQSAGGQAKKPKRLPSKQEQSYWDPDATAAAKEAATRFAANAARPTQAGSSGSRTLLSYADDCLFEDSAPSPSKRKRRKKMAAAPQ